MTIKQLIKHHEGFSQFPYRDAEGNLTIGYGWNLNANGLPQDICEELLTRRIIEIERTLKKELSCFHKLSDTRQEVLIDMAYCMGIRELLGFTRMVYLLEEATKAQSSAMWYKVVAYNILDSKFGKRFPKRSKELALAMSSNSWEHLKTESVSKPN